MSFEFLMYESFLIAQTTYEQSTGNYGMQAVGEGNLHTANPDLLIERMCSWWPGMLPKMLCIKHGIASWALVVSLGFCESLRASGSLQCVVNLSVRGGRAAGGCGAAAASECPDLPSAVKRLHLSRDSHVTSCGRKDDCGLISIDFDVRNYNVFLTETVKSDRI